MIVGGLFRQLGRCLHLSLFTWQRYLPSFTGLSVATVMFIVSFPDVETFNIIDTTATEDKNSTDTAENDSTETTPMEEDDSTETAATTTELATEAEFS